VSNVFRRLLLDQLQGRGYGKYDLEWNVRCDYFDVEQLWHVANAENIMEIDVEQLWDNAIESTRYSLDNDDCYSTYSPATAARYGLPYHGKRKYKRRTSEICYHPAGKPGWILDKPYVNSQFDCTFELQGRQGKHLVLTHFEGIECRDLDCKIEDGDVSNQWCRNLLAMLEEWDVCFTPERASENVKHYMVDQIEQDYRQMLEEWEES
jgi:hypothetical protein